MLLTIPLSTMNLTQDIIQKAFLTIGGDALEKWLNETFNPSILSKRKTLFAQSMTTWKLHEKSCLDFRQSQHPSYDLYSDAYCVLSNLYLINFC